MMNENKTNPVRRVMRRLAGRLRRAGADAGMTTAEYAVGTVAAVAFAAVLYKVIRTPAVQSALSAIITSALHVSL
ncbi:MAG: rane protein [Frankiales bacterium]|nr:rane protein [Frankiales bacterium]